MPKSPRTLSVGKPKPPLEPPDEQQLVTTMHAPRPVATISISRYQNTLVPVASPVPKNTSSTKSEIAKPAAPSGSTPNAVTTQKAKADAARM